MSHARMGLCIRDGQADNKGRAFARRAFRGDSAIVGFDYLTWHSESYAMPGGNLLS